MKPRDLLHQLRGHLSEFRLPNSRSNWFTESVLRLIISDLQLQHFGAAPEKHWRSPPGVQLFWHGTGIVDARTVCLACVALFSTSGVARFERLMAHLVRHLGETKCQILNGFGQTKSNETRTEQAADSGIRASSRRTSVKLVKFKCNINNYMASCSLWRQQRTNERVASMLIEKAFWTHCTFGSHRKGTRLLAFLLTISLSPTLLSRRTFRRSCVVFKGLSTNQRSHLQAALNARKVFELLLPRIAEARSKGMQRVWSEPGTLVDFWPAWKPAIVCSGLDYGSQRMYMHWNSKGNSAWRKGQEAK